MSLPKGWIATELGEIGRWGSGGTPRASESSFYDGSIPWIRSGDLPDGDITEHSASMTEAGLNSCSAKWVGPNSVLIAMYGATIGKVGITTYPVTTNQAVAFVKPGDGVDPRYVFHNLRSRKSEFIALGQGGAQPNISQEIIKAQPIALPPAAEQRRIVAKLEELTARIARARGELDRATSIIARLRGQTIDAAVSGLLFVERIGETWSEADRLAISERRSKYLTERKGSRLRSGLENDVAFLGGERSGWLNCRLADVITLRVGHAFKSTQFSDDGLPLLRGANVAPGAVDWTDIVRLPRRTAEAFSALTLIEGDIVLAMDRPVISTGLKIARIGASDAGCLLVQRVANPRPSEFIYNEYLALVLRSYLFMEQIAGHATGSDLPHISGNDILTAPCPLPPLRVQKAIVDQVEKVVVRADRLEVEAIRARSLLVRLESTILTKAFSGQLVSQDPNDEPASVLLDRIQVRRASAAKTKGKRRNAVTA